MSVKTKIISIIAAIVILALAGFIYFKFYFVLGMGVKAGELNHIVYKGWVWKTYEGRLIQAGFKGAKGGGSLQSNEFNFSVVKKSVADSLMRCSGKHVELHYKEYKGRLPWRGHSRYVVDSIVFVNPTPMHNLNTIPIVPDDGYVDM